VAFLFVLQSGPRPSSQQEEVESMRSATEKLIAVLLLCVAITLTSACASASPATAHPNTEVATAPKRDWGTLSHEERKAHMRDAVLPAMERHFLAQNGERFANFGCKNCHGAHARERNYAMPCPDLPTLYPTGTAEQIATVQQHREMARFMFQKVTPNMRKLLNQPRYNPQTGEGFSCFYCHPRGEPN
jgi:hypothetical protein